MNMTTGYLRPINERELQQWQALSHDDYVIDLMKSFDYPRNKAEQEAAEAIQKALPLGLNTPLQHIRIYEHEHHAVGYLWYSLEERSAFLLDLMLLPSHQGKGLGKDMMQALINELRDAGANELELRVAPHNQRAISLYEQAGFRLTGLDMHLTLTR
ncbi:GNAT family N-acetyltransferase [Erwinia aphidicola]|uniref:GNAT family N-acetyltransferase n=1 Tax=Erwinia aphidicola TaxID=68334 RepID=UPI0016549C33